MKFLPLFQVSLLVLAAIPAVQAQPATAPTTSAAAPAPAATFTEGQLLETFGWFVGRRIGIAELGFTAEQIEAIIKGIKQAAAGGEAPYDLDAIGPQLDVFMQAKQNEYMAQVRAQSAAQSATLLAEAAKRPGAQVLPSGVVYEVIQAGSGNAPKLSDTVTVHYTGRLADGTVFDSSLERGQPAQIRLDEAIEGWQEGLQKTSKGGKIRLSVPADQGYGDNPPPGSPIPPAAALDFEIELLDLTPAAAAPAMPGRPVN
jgi:FKBP-type peptidyl-prolyl cis-trans isomerase